MKLWVYAFSKSQISNMCNSAFINKVSLKFPNFREAKKIGMNGILGQELNLKQILKLDRKLQTNNNDLVNNVPLTNVAGEGGPHLAPQKFLLS